MSSSSETLVGYSGYRQPHRGDSDELLVRTGAGSACGEYLRRYWQPVALTREVTDVPRLIRVLGEELVLFRDRSGRYGLVHKQCPHRRASMEFGVCEDRGIRCCYHGWLFDVDGQILDIPGQPENIAELVKRQTSLGAYPVKEYRGLIFAYLGPIEQLPEFPVYDTLEIEGQTLVPYRADYNCNWLQVLDAILDPIHTSFLHSRMSRAQFSEGLGEIGELLFYEREMSFLGANVRRVDDHVWVRVNELVLPNYTQAGAAFSADGTRPIYYGRTAFSRWVVPIDDETTTAFAWAIFGDRADPEAYNTPEGPELIEQGELMDRSYDERQRFPGDAEAVEGMGRIADQKLEHLVPSDKGIIQYRKRLRKLCRELESGSKPPQVADLWQNPIPTYGGDTVLRLPAVDGDDAAFLNAVGDKVMQFQFDAESMRGTERDEWVIDALKQYEAEKKYMSTRLHIKNITPAPIHFRRRPRANPFLPYRRTNTSLQRNDFPVSQSNLMCSWTGIRITGAESMRDTEILLTWDLPTRDLAQIAPKLKWIHCIGAGVEHLCPMDWVPEGVTITNNKGAHADKAGEFALMAVLMLHNKMPAILSNQREARWNSLFSTPIEGKTVGLIGVGSIGGGAAAQLDKMPVHIIGVSRHGKSHPHVHEMVAMDQLDSVLPRMDYLFVSIPATPETRGLFNRERLQSLQAGAG